MPKSKFPSPSVGTDGTGYKVNGHRNTGPITQALGNFSSLHQPPTAAGGPCRPSTSAGRTPLPKTSTGRGGVPKGGVERGGFLPYHNFPCSPPPGFMSLQITLCSQEDNIYLVAAWIPGLPGKRSQPCSPASSSSEMASQENSAFPPLATDPNSPKLRTPPFSPMESLAWQKPDLQPILSSSYFSEVPTLTSCWHTKALLGAGSRVEGRGPWARPQACQRCKISGPHPRSTDSDGRAQKCVLTGPLCASEAQQRLRLTGATAKNLNSRTRVPEFKSQLYKPLTG